MEILFTRVPYYFWDPNLENYPCGFRVQGGLRFGAQGLGSLGFGIWGSGFGVEASGARGNTTVDDISPEVITFIIREHTITPIV